MGIEEDDDGSLWLSTRHGLSRLDPATGRVANLPSSELSSSAPSGHRAAKLAQASTERDGIFFMVQM